MNYEKLYKNAIENAKGIINYYKEHNRGDEAAIEDLEGIFPELQESEDERIRKELIDAINGLWVNDALPLPLSVGRKDKWIAWLEKQGEPTTIDIDKMVLKYSQTRESCTNGLPVNCQIRAYRQGINDTLRLSFNLEKQGEQKVPINDFKAKNWYVSEVDGKIHDMTYNPADKIEPKFKVRDWIINDQGSAFQIAYIDEENCRYVFEIGGYTKEEMNYENIAFANNHYRKWTIEDAKDGDVLYSLDSKQPFVFKHRKPNEQAVVYCGINTYGKFFIGNTKDCIIMTDKYIPATKEQRDTLFKAMAKAGYQWNPDTKELKKVEQKPTWSEEDDAYKLFAISAVEDYYDVKNPLQKALVDWLKSLKERLS